MIETITDYFTKICIIWDELENYKPDPIILTKFVFIVERLGILVMTVTENMVFLLDTCFITTKQLQ